MDDTDDTVLTGEHIRGLTTRAWRRGIPRRARTLLHRVVDLARAHQAFCLHDDRVGLVVVRKPDAWVVSSGMWRVVKACDAHEGPEEVRAFLLLALSVFERVAEQGWKASARR